MLKLCRAGGCGNTKAVESVFQWKCSDSFSQVQNHMTYCQLVLAYSLPLSPLQSSTVARASLLDSAQFRGHLASLAKFSLHIKLRHSKIHLLILLNFDAS